MAVNLGRLEVTTSDHVVLRYDLAAAGNRGFAAIVDFFVAALMTSAIVFAWLRFGQRDAPQWLGVVILLALVVGWGYFVLLEWLWNGQTIGKRLYGLRVIGDDGAPATFVAVLVRNLVRVADFLPGFYGFGLAAIALSPRSQRLGDLAAGTFVVRAPRPRLDWLALRTAIGAAERDVPAGRAGEGLQRRTAGAGTVGRSGVPDALVDLSLSGEAQRLVREFVARERALPPARRAALAASLAAHLRPRVRDLVEPDDVELIRAVARALRARGDR